MWIKTGDGTLINMDQVELVYHCKDTCTVKVVFNEGDLAITSVAPESDCKLILEKLYEKLNEHDKK